MKPHHKETISDLNEAFDELIIQSEDYRTERRKLIEKFNADSDHESWKDAYTEGLSNLHMNLHIIEMEQDHIRQAIHAISRLNK